MLAALKSTAKKILTEKQHKRYEKTLKEKRLSYHDWITIQEKKIQIADYHVEYYSNYQTIESLQKGNGKKEMPNEGIHAENGKGERNSVFFARVGKKGKNKEFLYEFIRTKPEKSAGSIRKNMPDKKADVVVFLLQEGKLSPLALPLLTKSFEEDESLILIYGDEDCLKEEKEGQGEERIRPWFKPDWSPDTFLSYFYFGSLVALRRESLEAALSQCPEGADLYSICLAAVAAVAAGRRGTAPSAGIRHIPEVLFHGKEDIYEQIKTWHLSVGETEAFEQSFRNIRSRGNGSTVGDGSAGGDGMSLISVIIPSKDNPEVLFTCISSLRQKTRGVDCEILIIDNGSSKENRERIREMSREFSVSYYYEPMPFNFSRMCNLGASYSRGAYLLFLNDDMEIVQDNWLELLLEKASLSYTGAVGAKLLYPGTDIIQHAGITNLRVGPAHKLQFLHDNEDYYYGKNRYVHDVMGVTGACLLLKRELFERLGGFDERLAVAFNDVDLCYSLFEAGFYNVVRNDVILTHHESLSRGKDGESEEKQLRLLREKDVLYAKHQDLYGKDPFYHKYLTTDMLDTSYSPAFRYQVTLDMPWAEVIPEDKLPDSVREDECVVIGMEAAMDIYKWKYGVDAALGKQAPSKEDMGYYFQGYTFVIGSDNACYKKTLLLQNKETLQILRISTEERYRPDIRDNLQGQLNVDLTGFAAKVAAGSVPKGNYRFGMLMEDKCSRQKLVRYSSWTLLV